MVIVYDIETHAFGRPNPYKDIPKVFGCFDTERKLTLMIPFENNRDVIQSVLSTPDDKVTYNGTGYDAPLLRKRGYVINGEHIDMLGVVKHNRGTMGYPAGLRTTLKDVCNFLKFPVAKGDIDYGVFRKDELIRQRWEEICLYLVTDLNLTLQLYQHFEEQIKKNKEVKYKLLTEYM